MSRTEAQRISTLVANLRASSKDASRSDFYSSAWQSCKELPSGLYDFLEHFKRSESEAAVLIRGFPLDDEQAGPTPSHWRDAAQVTSTSDQELTLGLCGMILGEPFTWATLQQGRLIQNVLPIAGDELAQNGHGSEALLEFHTEDGFHPQRCDYLMLFGIRNTDQVPTILASVRDIKLSAHHRRVLGEPRFHIRPDGEHVRQLTEIDGSHPALAEAQRMTENPEGVAALFGDPDRPYVRIDPPFMNCADGDHEARAALEALVNELERQQQSLVVERGTLLIVDNYIAVHGRKPFNARYDGTDRWLKKLVVSRNLRVSLRNGTQANSRALF